MWERGTDNQQVQLGQWAVQAQEENGSDGGSLGKDACLSRDRWDVLYAWIQKVYQEELSGKGRTSFSAGLTK